MMKEQGLPAGCAADNYISIIPQATYKHSYKSPDLIANGSTLIKEREPVHNALDIRRKSRTILVSNAGIRGDLPRTGMLLCDLWATTLQLP